MTSAKWFERAQKVIPGGVNSPVRAFNGVGGTPVYFKSGKGVNVQTEDGTELIDFCGSWGPLILGHARDEIVDVVAKTAADGLTFGANTAAEAEFAELITTLIPEMDMVRLVSSGTEAVMSAIRLARGYTGRRKIIKFDGCYHGHSDYLLVAAGSGLLTGGTTSSAGVSPAATEEVYVVPYNDLEKVQDVLKADGENIAAVIVEPIAGNMGLVEPEPGFLEGLREATAACGTLLIFDEVINGFRLAPTTFGHTIGIEADITTLGKIIGGGMPIGALGGSTEIMSALAPLGPVYQAGTLSGNPVAVAAGMKTLELLRDESPYLKIEILGKKLADGINAIAEEKELDLHCAQRGGMFTPFFRKEAVRNLDDSKACDQKAHAAYFHHMLNHGFYTPPSGFEVAFVSAAHTEEHINAFLEAFSKL
ncbi:glutamate-1-semialdehyde 2,1-aminomutase [Pontiella agarivorans]|uniref:Glutamate-1-semialdehyde 2,1-aminomutase n=1 Tax=Pontiella agarivorans TaxID=3038953 RepID=A0ABU5MXA9_9BACT|nr:glutamate-1-semialdehyde 2,1-aminomutase [Pontiella agarivorans]MDZ8118839.1 glutamate-1-semialdehyde 2,1-aminomutase [Pontiella agarivorans]